MTIDLNRAARALSSEAGNVLYRYGFKDIPPVQIELFESVKYHGLYCGGQNLIKINKNLILNNPWYVVLEILKHELAHHVAYHNFADKEYTAHGAGFQRAADALALDSKARKATVNLIGLKDEMDAEKEKILQRAKKLEEMAGRTDNAHEAANALRRLQELQAKYNLEAWRSDAELQINSIWISFGVQRRRPSWSAFLTGLLAEVYNAKCIFTHEFVPAANRHEIGIEYIGTPEALEMIEYAWHYILRSMEAAYKEYDGRKHRAAKNAFNRAFILGIQSNFKKAEQTKKENPTADTQELVIVDEEITKRAEEYLNKKYQKLRYTRFGGGRGDSSASEAGHAAGQKMSLNRGVRTGSTKLIGA